MIVRGMNRRQHNFDTDFLNKVARQSNDITLFTNIFVNRWNAMDRFGVGYTCDEIMAKEHNDSNFDSNGINRQFFSVLSKMRAYRPVVYSGGNVHTQESTGRINTVNVKNTGTGDLHCDTQIALIPPICEAPRYSRLRSKNSSDEVFVLQTVNRIKYIQHIRSLMQTIKTIRQIFDVTDVEVSGGYRRRNGDVSGQPSHGFTDDRLKRAKVEFQASIEYVIDNSLQLNPLWMDLSACVIRKMADRNGSQSKISNYEIFRCILDASSDWFASDDSDDDEDILSGILKVVKDKQDIDPVEMTNFLETIADDTSAPTTMSGAKDNRKEYARSSNYISRLMDHQKRMYSYMFLIAMFIQTFDLPKIGQIKDGEKQTFSQNDKFSTTLCSDV